MTPRKMGVKLAAWLLLLQLLATVGSCDKRVQTAEPGECTYKMLVAAAAGEVPALSLLSTVAHSAEIRHMCC